MITITRKCRIDAVLRASGLLGHFCPPIYSVLTDSVHTDRCRNSRISSVDLADEVHFIDVIAWPRTPSVQIEAVGHRALFSTSVGLAAGVPVVVVVVGAVSPGPVPSGGRPTQANPDRILPSHTLRQKVILVEVVNGNQRGTGEDIAAGCFGFPPGHFGVYKLVALVVVGQPVLRTAGLGDGGGCQQQQQREEGPHGRADW